MFWTLIIAIGVAWVVQSWFSFQQTKAFTKVFVAMRRKGRVAMGKFRGGLAAGSIVMFVLDEDDRIVEGQRLGGVTVMARFKPFPDYDGQFVSMIDPNSAAALGKPVVRALENLKQNYKLFIAGGTPAEPPTALGRLLDKLPGTKPKQRTLNTPLAAVASPAKKKIVVRRDKLAA